MQFRRVSIWQLRSLSARAIISHAGHLLLDVSSSASPSSRRPSRNIHQSIRQICVFLPAHSMDRTHEHSVDGSDIPLAKRPRTEPTSSSEDNAVPQRAATQVRSSKYVVCAYMRAHRCIEKEFTPSRSSWTLSSCCGQSGGNQRRRRAPSSERLLASGLPGVAHTRQHTTHGYPCFPKAYFRTTP